MKRPSLIATSQQLCTAALRSLWLGKLLRKEKTATNLLIRDQAHDGFEMKCLGKQVHSLNQVDFIAMLG